MINLYARYVYKRTSPMCLFEVRLQKFFISVQLFWFTPFTHSLFYYIAE